MSYNWQFWRLFAWVEMIFIAWGWGGGGRGNTISAVAFKQLLLLVCYVFEQIVIGIEYIVRLPVNE